MKKIIRVIKRYLRHTAQSARMSEEMVQKMDELVRTVKHLTNIVSHNANATSADAALILQSGVNDGYQGPPTTSASGMAPHPYVAVKKQPLVFASNTFNPNHEDYDAERVRNFPGTIFNFESDTSNTVFAELKKLARRGEISDSEWRNIMRDCLEEAKTVPHAEQVFERKTYVENYMADLKTKYQSTYNPGWVNLEDALFLYWTVRQLKPKRVVQTGVCNGLSAAFIMLALAKNGSEGTLHVVDMPPIFDSKDDNWKIKGRVYGVVIPEGKSSGWLVPDAYRDRFEVLNGDAKVLLPQLLKKIGSIDMFYHDSDHTYDHMMFEFTEAKKYLSNNGVMVSDDISWNASLWDFADHYMAPAYNYRGSMGIACF